jgi:dGTPase
VPHYGELLGEIRRKFPQAPEGLQFQEVLRGLINFLVCGFADGTAAALAVSAVADIEAVRAWPERLPRLTSEARETNSALKRFLTERVYTAPRLVRERSRATATIAWLFDLFLAHPEELPEPHRARLDASPPHRVVCDYIAGMTDGFCRRTARRLKRRYPAS